MRHVGLNEGQNQQIHFYAYVPVIDAPYAPKSNPELERVGSKLKLEPKIVASCQRMELKVKSPKAHKSMQ